MKMRYLIGGGMALLSPLVLASCNSVNVSSGILARTPQAQVHELKNGLRVEALPIERNDIAETLGMKMWKFNVTLPEPDQMLVCDLELRRKGKFIRKIGGAGVGPHKNLRTEVLIGLHPLEDSWGDSDKLKYLTRIGPNSASGVKENPFKVYSSIGYGDVFFQPDESFLLMVGSKGKSADWPIERDNDVALVLTMRLKPVQPPR